MINALVALLLFSDAFGGLSYQSIAHTHLAPTWFLVAGSIASFLYLILSLTVLVLTHRRKELEEPSA